MRVVGVSQHISRRKTSITFIFPQWDTLLANIYKKTLPLVIILIKGLKIPKENPRFLKYCTTFNGNWKSVDIVGKSLKASDDKGEFEMPTFSYAGKNIIMVHKPHLLSYCCFVLDPLPLSLANYKLS